MSYEDVIAHIKSNLAYYETHAHNMHDDFHPQIMVQGSVLALKEILEHFNESYPGHPLKCGEDPLHCQCGFSQITIEKVKTIAHYQCKCGHKWTDDEYPLATYTDCPACKASQNDPQSIERIKRKRLITELSEEPIEDDVNPGSFY